MSRTSAWLAAALAALVLLVGCGQPYTYRGTAYPEPLATPQFTLTSESGEPMQLSDLQDKVVLIFFGYTTCPDVCPTTLAEARTILNDLGSDAQDVTFLFVTVDPARDTPEKLAAYTDAFHPGIIGLTGEPDQLAPVYDEDTGNLALQTRGLKTSRKGLSLGNYQEVRIRRVHQTLDAFMDRSKPFR